MVQQLASDEGLQVAHGGVLALETEAELDVSCRRNCVEDSVVGGYVAADGELLRGWGTGDGVVCGHR